MSSVQTSLEFMVKETGQAKSTCPSIIELPVAEQPAQASMLSSDIKNKVLAWLAQPGQYQRADVSLFDRLEIARRFWDPERPWGEVSRLAETYHLSRVTIYTVAFRLAVYCQPRVAGPIAGLKSLLTGLEQGSPGPERGAFWSKEAAEQLRGRLILTGLLPGGLPLRPLEDMLGEVPGVGCSDSTIGRKIAQAGLKADTILRGIDFSQVSEKGVIVVIDETFFDDWPVLFAVEPGSLAICDFHLPDDGRRTAETWAAFLLLLKEDRELNIIGGMGDAATAYPPAFKTLLEADDQFREDHFHTLRDVQKLQQQLENSAYRAFKAEYQAAAQDEKQGTDKTRQKRSQRQAESLRLAEAYDAFSEYATWVHQALQIVDLSSGEIRDRQTNQWLLDEAILAMAQVNHTEVVKMSQRLNDHKSRLLAYLNDLDQELPPLQTSLAAYLQEPQLAQVVLRAVARHWRLDHEVQSNQRRNFRPALARAQQEVDRWIAGNPFLEQWAQQLHALLDGVLRTSSAVENINSIFKPLVHRKKHFASADSAHNFVALFVLWHNMRVFQEGKRQGQSPFQILGINLGQTDWRTLLGYAPLL